MKKFFITAMLMLSIAFGANAEDKKINVEINVPSTVRIFNAENSGVGIHATDKYIYDLIDYTISDDEIKINLKDGKKLEHYQLDDKNLKIFISIPEGKYCGIKSNAGTVLYTKKKLMKQD